MTPEMAAIERVEALANEAELDLNTGAWVLLPDVYALIDLARQTSGQAGVEALDEGELAEAIERAAQPLIGSSAYDEAPGDPNQGLPGAWPTEAAVERALDRYNICAIRMGAPRIGSADAMRAALLAAPPPPEWRPTIPVEDIAALIEPRAFGEAGELDSFSGVRNSARQRARAIRDLLAPPSDSQGGVR
jgi:hypothetical protein